MKTPNVTSDKRQAAGESDGVRIPMKHIWLGDKQHVLCSEKCVEEYKADTYDCDCGPDGFYQCSGFIEGPFPVEHGDVCDRCGVDCTADVGT